MKLIGPFTQMLTMRDLPLRGKIPDESLEIISDGGLLIDGGRILGLGRFADMENQYPGVDVEKITGDKVLLPALVDCHTHLCYGGSRAADFAMRNAGKTYLEIAENGGGIWSTVEQTRSEDEEVLLGALMERVNFLLSLGITTIEIKSGYGLSLESELKILRVIRRAQSMTPVRLVPTCLAAHIKPKDFSGNTEEYLCYVLEVILPRVKEENLSNRVDIFVEETAFDKGESKTFLLRAKSMGFDLCVHADQFTVGGSRLAVMVGAKSADHLEAVTEEDIAFLAQSDTVATSLPGASIGLGEPFAPARKLLDSGAILAIGSDWNPGSAPMGNLIAESSILAAYEKLTTAEVLSGITYRAAYALNIHGIGRIAVGMRADFAVFSTHDYQEILYRQGRLRPSAVYIDGKNILS
ncbi:MAG: imidazolonepropionase [Bergeyella sp.]|nr:imidazolonepropionase [Bergeyella sp.]